MPIHGLPPANGSKAHRMGFYNCILANLAATTAGVGLWDPTATAVYVFTPALLNSTVHNVYAHEARQYNPRIMD